MNLRRPDAVSKVAGRASGRARDGDGRLTTDPDRPPPAAEAATDAELIRRLRADDLDAFRILFERHRALIFRTAHGLTGDRHAAEEILQDTFLRAYRHRGTLRDDVSPVPWLHRVALNLCYTRLGRRRLTTDPLDESPAGGLRDGGLEPPEWAIREELRQAIRDGVAALAPKHQSVIVLYYLDGLSLQETATVLGVRLGTVKSRIHYALHALRASFEAVGPTPVEGPAARAGVVAGAARRRST